MRWPFPLHTHGPVSLLRLVVYFIAVFGVCVGLYMLNVRKSAIKYPMCFCLLGALYMLCFVPAMVMICYGFSGIQYADTIRVSPRIPLNDTVEYQNRGYNVFPWADAKVLSQYYGFRWTISVESYAYQFVAPLS